MRRDKFPIVYKFAQRQVNGVLDKISTEQKVRIRRVRTMTLDEAIEREEALAYSFGERWKRLGEPVGDLPELEAEHRQMAEWLKELKSYEEAEEEDEV